MNRRLFGRLSVGVLSAALVALVGGPVSASDSGNRSDLKNFQHVFVIMMENTGYKALIGNPNAPWINTAANTHGLATSYFGVIHPSQPNYVAATAGIQGIDSQARSRVRQPTLRAQAQLVRVVRRRTEQPGPNGEHRRLEPAQQ